MNRCRETRTRHSPSATGSPTCSYSRAASRPGGDRLAEAMGVVELPAVGVEHLRALAHAEPRARAGARTRSAPAPAGASRPAPPRGRRSGRRRGSSRRRPPRRRGASARARSGRSWARSACTTAALSCRRRIAGRLRSIARRASSWRNARLSARISSTPAALGLGERVEPRAQQRRGEVEADPRRDDGELVERLAALRAEPPHARQHRLHHAHRHGVARATPAPPSRRTGCRG